MQTKGTTPTAGFTLDLGGETFNASFVVLAAMGAATVSDGRLLSLYSEGEMSGAAADNGWKSMYVCRDVLTDAIKFVRGEADLAPDRDARMPRMVSTPITPGQVYRIGAVCSDTYMKLYLDNVEAATGPAYTNHPMGRMAIFAFGGQANTFQGHNAVAWDGPIMFAIGANVAWTAAELAAVDAWIVEEFNL